MKTLDANQLLAAEHQLLGFFHAKQGYTLESLIVGMALTKEEFQELLATGAVSQIDANDLADIHELVNR
jgi:hypothetical protein